MFETVLQVQKKAKPFTKPLRICMLVFGILFILLAIMFSTGLMFPGACMILLYYVYGILSQKEYEYRFSGRTLAVFVISGRRYRRQVHELDLDEMEVTAPHWHEAVAKYKKKSGSVKLKKYDYTSYRDDIPYYTMIIKEDGKKIKLLLDLTEDVMRMLKQMYPDRVFLNRQDRVSSI